MLKFCLIAAALCFSSFSYSQNKWLLVTEPFPPYLADELPQDGWLAELIKEALASQSITIDIEFTPWTRAIKLLESNKRTAIIGIYYSVQRAQQFYFSRPVAKAYTGLFKRKNDQYIHYDGSIESLLPYSISKGSDYLVSEAFANNTSLAITETENLVSSLRVLQLGRVDLVAGTKAVGEYWLQNHPELQTLTDIEIEYIKPHLANHYLHLTFSKSAITSALQLLQFEKGIETIIDNGVAATVMKKHGFTSSEITSYLAFLKRR